MPPVGSREWIFAAGMMLPETRRLAKMFKNYQMFKITKSALPTAKEVEKEGCVSSSSLWNYGQWEGIRTQ